MNRNLKHLVIPSAALGLILAAARTTAESGYVTAARAIMTDTNGVVVSHDDVKLSGGAKLSSALQPNTDILVAGVTTTGSVNAASVGGEGIWRFITLTNGVALEVYKPSTTNWVRQTEWTEN